MLYLIFTLTVASIVTLLLIVGLALRDPTPNLSKRILIALAISACGLLVDFLPSELPPPRAYEIVGKFVSVPYLGLLWWFALSLLDDKFALNRTAWAGMAATSLLLLALTLGDVGVLPDDPPLLGALWDFVSAAVVVHIVWVGISGVKDDLINPRREARAWIASVFVLALMVGVGGSFVFSPLVLDVVRLVIILPGMAMTLFWLARFQTSVLAFRTGADAEPAKPAISPKDVPAYNRLLEIMKEEKAWLDPELSITGLAERVGVPAHQLRIIINQGMGYRNFTSFLAHYRLAAVKAALADPENARTPILTLALNAGFSSIATFNRTFKAETGQTAGEFRKSAELHGS